ncbi:MAG TPA: hypothetical protein VMR34_05340 [Candidatus Saccharimonadales bacterium]|nr:hypothetical protein [Candidatus Saccharimonadales bacterium]
MSSKYGSQEKKAGLTIMQMSILLSIFVVFVFVAYLLFHSSDQSIVANTSASSTNTATTSASSDATTTSNPYAVLPPATVPSKAAECSQQITYSSNGVPGPTKCSNGGLNTLVWGSFAALEPEVMSLGYDATASQVETALCSDVHANISNPIEEATYQITSLYYNWSFTTDPSTVINNGTCVNVDD